MSIDKLIERLRIEPGRKISLKKDFDPGWTPKSLTKEGAAKLLQKGVQLLGELQDKLYAQNQWSILAIFQAMDAAGKDGAIKHVMSGINPQGCQVYSFKAPSSEELDHDYLWRCAKAVPERGRIGIFNRSYYEEVLVARVHPEILAGQHLPVKLTDKNIWKRRFDEINQYEKYLSSNGVVILKFFLNVSKKEQKKRFLERINRPEKNWKFSAFDVKERGHWDDYQAAYEEVFNHTSTKWAPWYVIPADAKWFTRLCVAAVLYRTMEDLNLNYPEVSEAHRQQLREAKKLLEAE